MTGPLDVKSGKETFVRKFQGSGIVAVLTFTITNGNPVGIRCNWTKRLTKRRLDRIHEEYMSWRNDSWRVVREKYGIGRVLVIDL